MPQAIKLQSASRNIIRMPKGHETTALFSDIPNTSDGCLFVVAEGIKAIFTRPDLTSSIPVQVIPNELKDLREGALKNVPVDYICNRIKLSYERASLAVYNEKISRPDQMRDFSGSSASSTFIWGNTAFIGQVGISRVYLFRDLILQRLTRDHSVYAELELKNELTEDDKFHEYTWGQHLTRALGHKENVVADIFMQNLETGDQLLLCSSNTWLLVPEEQLIQCLTTANEPEIIVENITKILPVTGSYDFSFIVIKVVSQ